MLDPSQGRRSKTFLSAQLPFIVLWAVSLFILFTFDDKAAVSQLEFGSAFRYALVACDLALSALVILGKEKRSSGIALVLFVAFVISLKVRTPWLGRDAVLLLLTARLLLVTAAFLRIPVQWKLLFFSVVISLFIADQGARKILHMRDSEGKRLVNGLPDYGQVTVGTSPGGGDILANADMQALGEDGAARFRTDRWGFRHDGEIDQMPDANTFRVICVGDSVVYGYRTDQHETIAYNLERTVAPSMPGKKVEVLIARANSPALEHAYLRKNAFAFKPNLIIAGLTIANDLYPTLLDRQPSLNRVTERLPEAAFEKRTGRLFLLRLHNAYLRWAPYHLLLKIAMPNRYYLVDSQPFDVPVFEENNTLGVLYDQDPIELVDRCLAETVACFDEMKRMCDAHGTGFMVVIFPQAFQVDRSVWRTMAFEYGLDPRTFNLDEPHATLRRMLEEYQIDYVDTLEPLRASKEYCFFPSEMHLNRRGQALVANALSDRLTATGLERK
jgi:hypothetical protein